MAATPILAVFDRLIAVAMSAFHPPDFSHSLFLTLRISD